MTALVVIAALLASPTAGAVKKSTAPCTSVDDCWLSSSGEPIARPASKKGHPIPRGDCDSRLVWLRNLLSCEEKVCTARFVGDRC